MESPKQTEVSASPPKKTASDKVIKGSDVVAAGASPQFLQLPSPIYLAEWISPTQVLIGAGGGGSRFGMANVLVLLAIHTEASPDRGASTGATAAPAPRGEAPFPVRLTPATQKAVSAADRSGSTNAEGGGGSDNVPGLWRFVAALDLGGDVPWCSSRFLPWPAEPEATTSGETGRGEGRNHFVFSQRQRAALGSTVGFFALSSVKSFSLVAVVRSHGLEGGTGNSNCAHSLRLLARIVLPNDPFNPDKKPIALVSNAVVVAHDASGVLLYDLATLVPESDAVDARVTEATPLASWSLPARVNDLHANRVNLTQARASSTRRTRRDGAGPCGEQSAVVKALLLDFVVVAAAVQDKTVRLASFRLRRNYGAAPLPAQPAPPAEESGGEGEATDRTARRQPETKIEDMVVAPFSFLSGNVLHAEDLGLAFKPLASSFRLVRLFGLEDLAPWPGAAESARRRATNYSLSSTPGGAALPALSLLVVVYDPKGNQSYFVSLALDTALTFLDVVPWRHTGINGAAALTVASSTAAGEADPCLAGGAPLQAAVAVNLSQSPVKPAAKANDQPAIAFRASVNGGPSAVAMDCVTCLSASHAQPTHVAGVELLRRNPFGAALPLDWIVGTVDGWLVQVIGRELAEKKSMIEFCGCLTRPVLLPPSLKNKYPPLHKEPITAVAISSENDVLSTDLAQNVAISTLPFMLQSPAKSTSGGQHQPALMKKKRDGLQLFPPDKDGNGDLLSSVVELFSLEGKAQKVAALVVLGSLILTLLVLARF